MKISKANALQERLQNSLNKKKTITIKELIIERKKCVICFSPTTNDFICSSDDCKNHPNLIEAILDYDLNI